MEKEMHNNQLMRRHENRACLGSSQMPPLKRNGMVWWGIGRQVKFLNRHRDSNPCDPWSSTSFVKGSKERFDLESDEDSTDENEDEDIGEEREEADEDDKKAIRKVGNGLGKNTRKAQKVKHEMQSFKKTRRKRFKKIIVGSSINRWPAKRYKKAEVYLVEVIKSRRAVFKWPILSPDPRLRARKRIVDTRLVDNLRNVSSELAPGGAERFRRPNNADGQVERRLDTADSTPVQVVHVLLRKKQLADTSDSLMRMKQMMRGHEHRTCLDSSQMPPVKSNGMVRLGTQRQVKFLNRHGDSSTCDPWSSTRFAKGSKEKFDHESDEDDSHDDEEDVGEEREDTCKDDEKVVRKVGNGLRENTRKAQKVKHETQIFKKTSRKKFKKRNVGSSINRWPAKTCKKAEVNLLEVIESKGEAFKSPIPMADLTLKARKRLDNTCLVDHLKNMSSKLAPGGAERFGRPHSADVQVDRWLESDDSTLVQVKKQLADTSDPLMGMEDTLPLSTCKLLKARESCGGGPKRRVVLEKAPEGSSKNQSEEMNATQVNDLSIQIGNDDLDKCLEYDIFKIGRNKRFETPVADQRDHHNCGPISISECIGLTYAIETQSYNPRLAAQEPLNWMQMHEPSYYLDPYLFHERYIVNRTKRYSFPMSMSDVYSYIQENGIHTEGNYPFVGYCKTKFPVDVKKYEKMRATYLRDMTPERYSIKSFKHLNVNENIGREAGIIQEVKAALRAGRPVNGLMWASDAFFDFKGHAIFDQELDKAANHIVMITGYGTYKGTTFFRIKNSWTSEWGDGGYAYVTIRQIREFAYVDGEVYCMGSTPPKRIMVFYTTKSTEKFAKEFAYESNKRFAISWSENLLQSNVIFIPNDLEDYANSVEEYKAKFVTESSALFLMDYEERSKAKIKKEGIYLSLFFELLNEDNQSNWLKDLKYAVFGFGLHQIAEVTDRNLDKLGGRRLMKMLRSVRKSYDERQFGLWKNMIWKELEEICKGGEACTSRGGLDRRGKMTRPLKNQKINWLNQNWWNIEAEFHWVKSQNLSYHLTKKQVQTLEPGGYLVDNVVNSYLQLLKEREFKNDKDELFGEGSMKFFFMPSDFMVQANNYLSRPYQESSTAMYKLFEEYSKQHNSPLLIESDYAFVPTCVENHWILFVWCISESRILLFDPRSHDMEDEALREMYIGQFYIVEKLFPCMLNYLDASTYSGFKSRNVEIYKKHPIQENSNDSGVFVCKYVDALCRFIDLEEEKWSKGDVLTFRHRMAHELEKGRARHFTWLSVKRRREAL